MPWKNGYYYRNRRKGSRVISEYVGAGLLGEQAAEEDQLERAQAAQEREARKKEAQEYQAVEEQINQALQAAQALTTAALLLAGYHPHKRQWRRNDNRTNHGTS